MKKIYFILFGMCSLLFSAACYAQNASAEQAGMAVGMRANGKIYVVVAVVVTILLGLFLYLINLDKKISRMEKESRLSKGK
jgi:hypothetical protein